MKSTHVVIILLLSLSCASCKIRISPSVNGQVVSDSGAYDCQAGNTCEIDVVDSFFDETFRAVGNEGYAFAAWRTRAKSLCGGLSRQCRLSTTGFPGTPLMAFLESDDVFFLQPVFGKPNNWRRRADTFTGGVGVRSCVINGKLYVVGLDSDDPGAEGGQVEVFDPVINSWMTRSSLGTPRGALMAEAVRGKCYAIGGGTGGGGPLFGFPALDAVEEYDPSTDTWKPKAPLPAPRAIGGSAVVRNKIYVVGGSAEIGWFVTPSAAVAIYDPKTDTWASGADMPTPRIGLAVAAVNGLIYAAGGSNRDLGIYSSKIVERYNPETDQWTRVADLPVVLDFVSATALNGKFYVIGGLINPPDQYNGTARSSNAVYRYNPDTDKWSRVADMSVERFGHATASLDGQVYVVGGRTSREGPSVTSVEEFTP